MSGLKLSWHNLEPFSHILLTRHRGEKMSTFLSFSLPQIRSPLNLLLTILNNLVVQDTQCILILYAFQTFYQLCCYPLDPFGYLKNLFMLCFYVVESTTAHNIHSEAEPVLNTVGELPLLTGWLC